MDAVLKLSDHVTAECRTRSIQIAYQTNFLLQSVRLLRTEELLNQCVG
jgi:hypothetical protein